MFLIYNLITRHNYYDNLALQTDIDGNKSNNTTFNSIVLDICTSAEYPKKNCIN